MSSKANPEQQLAIEHQGGVLLSAGAGSGKTFVLIQHLVYLVRTKLSEFSIHSIEDREKHVAQFFSQIVLMTFTKKATGELKIRLTREAENEQYSEDERRAFKIAFNEISISTIHGYCMKLIGQGLISGIAPDVEIVSELSFYRKMKKLFDQWLEKQQEDLNGEQWFLDILNLNQDKMLSSLLAVFQTPELRTYWSKTSGQDIDFDLTEYLQSYFHCKDTILPHEWEKGFSMAGLEAHEKLAWYKIVKDYSALASRGPIRSIEEMKEYMDFFDGIKQLRKPSAKLGLSVVEEAFEHIGAVRGIFKGELFEPLSLYYEHKDQGYRIWSDTFKSAFDFIDQHYLDINGLIFSDLEYFVLKALSDPEQAQRIAAIYQYFIVDEFQDTSMIQYQIILNSALGNYERIFCVGDVKQAIYGFRGGELGVFRDCSEKIGRVLELSNNYRSEPTIIEFNNFFFEKLFKLGHEYKGHDHFSVEVLKQTVPRDVKPEDHGAIFQLEYQVNCSEDGAKLSNDDLSQIEAAAIVNKIQALRKAGDDRVACVLYKNLKPSRYLVAKLMQEKMSFTAQVKVEVPEEPVLALFSLIIDLVLVKTPINSAQNYLLQAYMAYLDLPTEEMEEKVQLFFNRLPTRGLFSSFQLLMRDLSLSNSNFEISVRAIRDLIDLAGGEIDKIKQGLDYFKKESFSFDFCYGDNSSQIILMTAHGSKGLEFPHVFLGGIHTNGFYIDGDELFGKMPGSFKWKTSASQRKYFKSPQYLLETAVAKKKDFSESKRLFYVAATRAEKSLSFVDIHFNEKPQNWTKNSWICGAREILAEQSFDDSLFQFHRTVFELPWANSVSLEGSEDSESTPLFHRDTMGIVPFKGLPKSVGLVPELSVTGFSQIASCPKKFYLSQVCKLKGDHKPQYELKSKEKNFIEGEEIKPVMSSMERGTLIHEVLSESLKHNFVIPLKYQDQLNPKDRSAVEWTLKTLKTRIQDSTVILSEEPVKFSLFGHMVSGTPDLLLIDEIVEVIDFKTGGALKSDDEHYWLQLVSYAYSVLQSEHKSRVNKFLLTLVYTDAQEEISKEFTISEIEDHLFTQWKKTSELDKMNTSSCAKCSFGNLCLPSSQVVAPL